MNGGNVMQRTLHGWQGRVLQRRTVPDLNEMLIRQLPLFRLDVHAYRSTLSGHHPERTAKS